VVVLETYANRGRLAVEEEEEVDGWGRRPTVESATSCTTPYWLWYWFPLNWRILEYSLVESFDSAASPVKIDKKEKKEKI
jgi:hypothetical protein